MKIAVTGANGFIGTNLIKRLKSLGLDYSVFDRAENNIFKPETLKNFLKGADAVTHLAAIHYGVKEIIGVNILGTKRLLDAVSEYCPKAKLVFASSFCVYDENDIFGLSKLTAEELIRDYVSYGLIKNAVVLRFSNIYGPGCKPFKNSVVSTFAFQIKNGKEIMINGTGKQKRDFLYIEDAVSAIEKVLSINIKKGFNVFDVSSKKFTSLNQIIKIMQAKSHKKTAVRYNGQIQEAKAPVKKHLDARDLPDWKSLTSLNKGLERLMSEN